MNNLERLAIRQAFTTHEIARLEEEIRSGSAVSAGTIRDTANKLSELKAEMQKMSKQVMLDLETTIQVTEDQESGVKEHVITTNSGFITIKP